jgi:photosystem II stability/assembly factor-like uncharacterized protein
MFLGLNMDDILTSLLKNLEFHIHEERHTMKRKVLHLTSSVLLMLSLGLTPGDCSDVFFRIVVLPCDQLPQGISYNDYDSFLLRCVSSRGRIYLVGDCGSVTLEYQAPGEPDLLSIARRFATPTAVAVGEGGTIVRRHNFIWGLVSSPTTHTLRSACPKAQSTDYYYAVGDSGTIIKSTDLGATWSSLSSPSTATFYEVTCGATNTVMVFGDTLGAYRSEDGGLTWQRLEMYALASDIASLQLPGPPDLYTSFFFNPDTGYVFGEYGVTFFTTNGGLSWQSGIAPGFTRINTAYFASIDSGVVAGDNGTIAFTTDRGMSWLTDSIPSAITSHNINHIGVRDSTLAVILGDSGTVVFVARDSTVLGAERSTGNVPDKFQLFQNYPNPFNPRSTISFEIPYTSDAQLQVFDMAGRGVATLVDERLTPGSYGFMFDGEGLASGVYLYRLHYQPQNGNPGSSLVRKMVLLR